jgi:drug/metabolite transporter (DMT)-like permease
LVVTVFGAHTILLLFFLAWRGEIKLDVVNITTSLAVLFALGLVVDVWHAHPGTHWLGMALACISAVIAVSRLYIYGEQTKTRNPIVVGAENFLIAAVLTLLVPIFDAPAFPASDTGWMFLGVGCLSMALGTFGMFYALSILGAFQYSLMAKVEPIITALFAVIVLNEVLKPSQYVGIVLVAGSLVAFQVLGKKSAQVVQQQEA